LQGADGEIYAVGQGQLTVGGFTAQGAGASVTRGVPTAGRIANGALVEREINYDLTQKQSVKIALHNPDLTTARRICDAINAYTGVEIAVPTDPGTVVVKRPDGNSGTMVELISDIENLRIEPDLPARVVIDATNGVIIIGGDVRISSVAIAQGNLTVSVTETPQVSQPAPFSQTGTTAVVPRTDIKVDTDDERRLAVVPEGVSLQELVDGLNALGVGTRDMISILQAIKAAGAMQADLEVL
jgi:flagellar P-ring protein precursor FlgI